MNIGNPIKALPRYAKLLTEGIQGKAATLPFINTAGAGIADNAIYNTALYANQNPLHAGGAVIGGVLANNMLGNPIGSLIDTATFGMTDFDNNNLSNQPMPPQTIQIMPATSTQPQQMQTLSLPALDEAERKKQIDYLQRKAATDLITINALRQQPGMEGYQ